MAKFRLEALKGLTDVIKELAVGLRNLTFSDNFKGFEVVLTIPANTELQVRNQLTYKPTKYIIVRKSNGSEVSDGPTAWSNDFLYLKNYDGSNETTITVIFFK